MSKSGGNQELPYVSLPPSSQFLWPAQGQEPLFHLLSERLALPSVVQNPAEHTVIPERPLGAHSPATPLLFSLSSA